MCVFGCWCATYLCASLAVQWIAKVYIEPERHPGVFTIEINPPNDPLTNQVPKGRRRDNPIIMKYGDLQIYTLNSPDVISYFTPYPFVTRGDVGGNWTRNTRQSVPLFYYTRTNLGLKISGQQAATHAPPRLLHETVEKSVLQHSQANIKTELPCLAGVEKETDFCARPLGSTRITQINTLY